MESCSPVVYQPTNTLVQIIYFVGIVGTTKMPNGRAVVKMWQNKGFIKLQQCLPVNKFPKPKHYVKSIVYFLKGCEYYKRAQKLL